MLEEDSYCTVFNSEAVNFLGDYPVFPTTGAQYYAQLA